MTSKRGLSLFAAAAFEEAAAGAGGSTSMGVDMLWCWRSDGEGSGAGVLRSRPGLRLCAPSESGSQVHTHQALHARSATRTITSITITTHHHWLPRSHQLSFILAGRRHALQMTHAFARSAHDSVRIVSTATRLSSSISLSAAPQWPAP